MSRGGAHAWLRLDSEVQSETLKVETGRSFQLHFSLPDEADWEHYEIKRLIARGNGIQQAFDLTRQTSSDSVDLTLHTSGVTLIAAVVGPKGVEDVGDSWRQVTYCMKTIVSVSEPRGDVSAGRRDPGVTAKVGQRHEIVALISPLGLTVGSDLPVRVFQDFERAAGVEVRAYGPDGNEQIETTNDSGFAHFRITSPGQWLIRRAFTHQGRPAGCELVFEVWPQTREESLP